MTPQALLLKVRMPQAAGAQVATLPAVDSVGNEYTVPLTPKLGRRMGGNTQRFFHATMDANGAVRLGQFADWQDW